MFSLLYGYTSGFSNNGIRACGSSESKVGYTKFYKLCILPMALWRNLKKACAFPSCVVSQIIFFMTIILNFYDLFLPDVKDDRTKCCRRHVARDADEAKWNWSHKDVKVLYSSVGALCQV